MITTYKGIHSRLFYLRGTASNYKCVDCDNKAQHWSWIHGTDEFDIQNYEPRCISCHTKYDYKNGHDHRGEGNPRCKVTIDEVIEIRRMHSEGWSVADLVYIFDSTDNTISKIVHRRTWRHI